MPHPSVLPPLVVVATSELLPNNYQLCLSALERYNFSSPLYWDSVNTQLLRSLSLATSGWNNSFYQVAAYGCLQSLDWTELDYWTPSEIECLALYQYPGTNLYSILMLMVDLH